MDDEAYEYWEAGGSALHAENIAPNERNAPAVSIRGAVEAFLAQKASWHSAEGGRSDARAPLASAFVEHGRELGELGPEFTELALDAFACAMEVDPSSVEAHCERAELLLDLGRDSEAVADIETALGLAPCGVPALLSAVGVLAAVGRHAEAAALEPRVRSAVRGMEIPALTRDQLDAFFECVRAIPAIEARASVRQPMSPAGS